MASLIQDITDRKRMEVTLRESEERYRTILEQAADAIFMRDESGRILEANQKACQSLGYSREELLAKSIWDIDPKALQAGKQRLWGTNPLPANNSHSRVASGARTAASFP